MKFVDETLRQVSPLRDAIDDKLDGGLLIAKEVD